MCCFKWVSLIVSSLPGKSETCQWHQRHVRHTTQLFGKCQPGLWTVKLMLSKESFWLKKVDSQLTILKDLIFGNHETRQLELWNLAQWDILSIVPGKCIGGLGAKINQALMWNHYRSPTPSVGYLLSIYNYKAGAFHVSSCQF